MSATVRTEAREFEAREFEAQGDDANAARRVVLDWNHTRIGAVLALGLVLGATSVLVTAPSMVRAEGGDSVQGFFRNDRRPGAPRLTAPPSNPGFLAPLVRQFAPSPTSADLPPAIRFGTFGDDPVTLRKLRKDDKRKAAKKGDDAENSQYGEGSIGGSGRRSICVRVCDGYFFPLGKAEAGVAGHEALCQAACPSAPMRVYSVPDGADTIEQSVAVDGKPYGSLPMAFAYQRERDPTCTCRREPGKRSVSLLKDFTLRKGDTVVVDGKALVFKGAHQWPFHPSDFSEFRTASAGLASGERSDIDRAVGISRIEEAMRQYQRRPGQPTAKVAAPAAFSAPPASGEIRRIEALGPTPRAGGGGPRLEASATGPRTGRAPHLTR